jgi:hypothetical protein
MATILYSYTYTTYMVILWLIACYTFYHYQLFKAYTILLIFPLAAVNEALGLIYKADVIYNFVFSLLQSLCYLAMLRHFVSAEDLKRISVIWLFVWCMGSIVYAHGAALYIFYLLEAVVWLVVYTLLIITQKHIMHNMVLIGALVVLIDTFLNITLYVLHLYSGFAIWHPLYDSAIHLSYTFIFIYTGYQLYYYHHKPSVPCSPISSSSL